MKEKIIITLLITTVTVYAQTFDNYTFLSAFIPEKQLPLINIDGNIREWKWVDNKYYINHSEMWETDNYPEKNKDFSVEFFTAWDFYNDYFYIAGTIIDDTINCDGNFPNDQIEIFLNPNLINVSFYNSNYKYFYFNIMWFIINLNKEGVDLIEMEYGPQWVLKDNSSFVCKSTVKKDNGIYKREFEVKVKIYSVLSLYFKSESKARTLNVNDKIGLTIAFSDVDKNNMEMDVQLRTYANPDYWHISGESCTFLLDKPLNTNDNILESVLTTEP